MNFLILGEGPEELAWAQALRGQPGHDVRMTCPGLKALPGLPETADLDAALATAGIEAVVVGGYPELRAEGLRRAAAEGLAIIALHPPGPNADPYYQVALSRQETGALVVPDLPLRRHPGYEALAKAAADGRLGTIRSIHYEAAPGDSDGDLLGWAFPRAIDAVRGLLGEVETVTATGMPPGDHPRDTLIVHLRGTGGRAGEVRLYRGPAGASTASILDPELRARLVLIGSEGTLALEHHPDLLGRSMLIQRAGADEPVVTELPPWDPKSAVLRLLADSAEGRPQPPDLSDATRAMEISEAVGRSLRRGRTVDLHYEEVSELSSFKAFMTSVGCALLLLVPVVYGITRVGLAFGLTWMRYVAWAIVPALALFALLQFLRFAARGPATPSEAGAASPERAPVVRERDD